MNAARRGLTATALAFVIALPLASCSPGDTTTPACDDPGGRANVLVAQSVPSATRLPCLESLPAGWRLGGISIKDSGATFWLDSVVSGIHAVEVSLAATCQIAGASEVVPAADEAGMHVLVLPTSLDPFQGRRFIVFDGGCVTYRYSFSAGTPPTVALEVDGSLSFLARDDVADAVEVELGATLCGAGAPPCSEGP